MQKQINIIEAYCEKCEKDTLHIIYLAGESQFTILLFFICLDTCCNFKSAKRVSKQFGQKLLEGDSDNDAQ